MRSALLAGTALAAALPAAQAAEPLRLELTGFYRFYAVVGEQDAAGPRGHGVGREGEVLFVADTTLPSGIAVGLQIELEAETSADQIDESFVFFEGAFGRVELGSADPATDVMLFGPPIPLPGHGVNSPNQFHVAVGGNLAGTSATFVNQTFDSDKITWFSPRVEGFQFGASYTPDNTEELGGGLRPDATPGQFSEAVEAGVNWLGRIGQVDLGAHLAVSRAEREVGGPGLDDRRLWGAGAQLGWRGVIVGASFRHDDLGLDGPDRRDWNAGAGYGTGRWFLAAAYARGVRETPAGDHTVDHLELGAQYQLGPGVLLVGGVQHVDFDGPVAAARNEGLLGLLGVEISF